MEDLERLSETEISPEEIERLRRKIVSETEEMTYNMYVPFLILTRLANRNDQKYYSQEFIDSECARIQGGSKKNWPATVLYSALKGRSSNLGISTKKGRSLIQMKEFGHIDEEETAVTLTSYRVNPNYITEAGEICTRLGEPLFKE